MRGFDLGVRRMLSSGCICMALFVFFSACSSKETGQAPGAVSAPTATHSPVDPAFSPEFVAWLDSFPAKISDKDARRLRREALDRLEKERSELRVIEQRETKQGIAERKRRRQEWLRSEKAARRKFFAENLHGPERRAYVQDFNARRLAFFEELKAESQAQKASFAERKKELQERQAKKMQAVENALRGLGTETE